MLRIDLKGYIQERSGMSTAVNGQMHMRSSEALTHQVPSGLIFRGLQKCPQKLSSAS